MPSGVCPKTCGQLSTAAVFIAVGVIQLLAGIILLKSEYVYFLAVTDFIASSSNVFVGCLLGIFASTWEKKGKHLSLKNTARQNVLAGLYISAITVNVTTALVMIMGDGNGLLTVTSESNSNNSAMFVTEILACAYVTSVCSPIVCIVVAIVCVSGNCIQLRLAIIKGAKKRDSVSKSDSYGWVFESESRNKPKHLSDFRQPPVSLNRNSSASEDSVFMEKAPSKDYFCRDSISSITKTLSPMEIWAQKRSKIMREITSPKRSFFNIDNYLQFPDYSYGSYMETILPRIKQTCLVPSLDGRNSQIIRDSSLNHSKNKMAKTNRSTFSNATPSVVQIDLNSVATIKNCPNLMMHSNTQETACPVKTIVEINGVLRDEFCQFSFDNIPHTQISRQNSYCKPFQVQDKSLKLSIGHPNKPVEICLNEDFVAGPEYGDKSVCISNNLIGCSNVFAEAMVDVCKNHTKTLELESDILKELKTNVTINPFDDKVTCQERRQFLSSFKSAVKKKSESDPEENQRVLLGRLSTDKLDVHSETSETSAPFWAGEFVPISVRNSEVNESSGVLTDLCSEKDESEDLLDFGRKEKMATSSISTISNKEMQYHERLLSRQHYNDKTMKKYALEYPKAYSIKHTEKKRDILQRISTMGSIAESPTEDMVHGTDDSPSPKLGEELVKSETLNSEETIDENANIKSFIDATADKTLSKNHPSLKHTISMSPSSLLKRMWHFTGSDVKADLSHLIMDEDSLVGLSEEELVARTHRIRLLRKSVEMRSKEENEDSLTK